MLLRRFRKERLLRARAVELGELLIAQARVPVLYETCGFPDTTEGRFEVLVLHLWLLLQPLKKGLEGLEDDTLARALIEAVFARMDRDMRESGVGDMGIPRRMRRLSAALYERLGTYDSLEADSEVLAQALLRTLNPDAPPSVYDALKTYLDANRRALSAWTAPMETPPPFAPH